MRRLLALLTLAAAALAAGACSSHYPYYSYRPAPAVANVISEGKTEARVLAAVTGVRKPDADAGTPALIEARLRIENHGALLVTLAPESVVLVTADLTALTASIPSIEAGTALGVPTGGSENLDVTFALPEGAGAYDYDLDGIVLRLELGRETTPVLVSLEFERLSDPYPVGWTYGPYLWHPWYGPYGRSRYYRVGGYYYR